MAYSITITNCGNCPFNHSEDDVFLSVGKFICWLDDDHELPKSNVSLFGMPEKCPLLKHNQIIIEGNNNENS